MPAETFSSIEDTDDIISFLQDLNHLVRLGVEINPDNHNVTLYFEDPRGKEGMITFPLEA